MPESKYATRGMKPATALSPEKANTEHQTAAQEVTRRRFQSYVWSNNSCYFDAPAELLFRTYETLPGNFRKSVQDILETEAKGTGIAAVFDHFEKRMAWTQGEHHDIRQGLHDGQSKLRELITSSTKWDVCKPGDFSSPTIWLRVMISRGNLAEIQLPRVSDPPHSREGDCC